MGTDFAYSVLQVRGSTNYIIKYCNDKLKLNHTSGGEQMEIYSLGECHFLGAKLADARARK